jgi:hypothetical protein
LASATALAEGPEPPLVGVGPPPGLAATPPEGVVLVGVDAVVVDGVEDVVAVVGGGLDVVPVGTVGAEVVVWVPGELVLEVVAAGVCVRLLPPHPVSASATTSAPRRGFFKACVSFVGSVRSEPV